MIKVFEVRTVERVMRTYSVQLIKPYPESSYDLEELKSEAEEQVRCGEVHKFMEGDAEIEEVLSVEEQK